MSDNKKYYYMRLVDNFYDRPEMKVIEKMENGYQYTTILLKMYLRSLKLDGLLMFTDEIPYDIPMLSASIGHEQAIVKMAVNIFQKYKLVEIMDDGAIYMSHIQNFIGESTTEADRKREFRSLINNHRTNVRQISDKSTPELELELELELEKELKTDIKVIENNDEVNPLYITNTNECNTIKQCNKSSNVVNKRLNAGESPDNVGEKQKTGDFLKIEQYYVGAIKKLIPGYTTADYDYPSNRSYLKRLVKKYDTDKVLKMYKKYMSSDIGKRAGYALKSISQEWNWNALLAMPDHETKEEYTERMKNTKFEYNETAGEVIL